MIKQSPFSNESSINELFRSAFMSMPVGQMIVNSDTTIKNVNNQLLKYFDSDIFEIENRMFGNIFKCAEIDSEHIICGQANHCKNCDIRNGLNYVLQNNKSVHNVKISHDFHIDGEVKKLHFQVSGAPLNDGDDFYALMVLNDITEMHENEKRLKGLLKLDLATGANNKHTLLKLLQKHLKTVDKNHCITICMIDFDHFKEMNDKYGHLAGDNILKTFSSIVNENIRDVDIFGRYGGEEFVIIFDNLNEDESMQILEEIYAQFKYQMSSAFKKSVTFSAGLLNVCSTGIATNLKSDDVINHVDKLLYTAKHNGRRRIVTPDSERKFK